MDSFSAKFSDRLTLYDPLEKPFPQEGESDQTVKHEQLIEKIHNMSAYRKPQKSEKLKDFKQVNMSYELELKLESMFNELEAEIQMVRTKHENHVRNDGKLLNLSTPFKRMRSVPMCYGSDVCAYVCVCW